MPFRVNHNALTITNTIFVLPADHTGGHITADGGDVTLTFANGDVYVVADGETFPIWHIGRPYEPITVTAAGAAVSAKCYWIMGE